MNRNLPRNFRSYAEMEKLYQDRHRQGIVSKPYLIKSVSAKQLLIFFGCRHSNDINDTQNIEIARSWNEFTSHNNKAKVAFCEGGLRPLETTSSEAIGKYSEPGLLTWLACKDGVGVVSPEPDETKELEYLLAQGFDIPEIMTYYFGRQMYQWVKRDSIHAKNWQSYASHYIRSYAILTPLRNYQLTLTTVLQMFEETTGRLFTTDDEKLLYRISDPTSNNVSAASGLFRDVSLFDAITNAWLSGKDIFALYGSGHAIILEKALKNLTAN